MDDISLLRQVAESRVQAAALLQRPRSLVAAGLFVLLWLASAALLLYGLWP